MINYLKVRTFVLALLITLLTLGNTFAADKVVVIPLIGNDSQLEPINIVDVLDKRFSFTNVSNKHTLFTVNDEYAWVITSVTIYTEYYPATRAPIMVRVIRGSAALFGWWAPNNEMTNIQFTPGDIYYPNGTYYLDVPVRGGLAETVSQQIKVEIHGYRVPK